MTNRDIEATEIIRDLMSSRKISSSTSVALNIALDWFDRLKAVEEEKKVVNRTIKSTQTGRGIGND